MDRFSHVVKDCHDSGFARICFWSTIFIISFAYTFINIKLDLLSVVQVSKNKLSIVKPKIVLHTSFSSNKQEMT